MCRKKRVVYGSDCDVPCSTEATDGGESENILKHEGLTK
jgi:hypothetical protein